MSELALVGIDPGKHIFHLHGQGISGREMFRKKLSRGQMMRFFGQRQHSLLQRRNSNVVACALANKLARIAWAISAHHTLFEAGSDAMAA